MSAEEIVLYTSIALGGVGIIVGLLTIWHSRYKGIGVVLGITETALEATGLYFATRLVLDSNTPAYKWAVLVPGASALLISSLYTLFSFSERYTIALASFETSWYAAGVSILNLVGGGALIAEKLEEELFFVLVASTTFQFGLYLYFKISCCCLKVEEHILKAGVNAVAGIGLSIALIVVELPDKIEFVPLLVVTLSRAVDYYDILKNKQCERTTAQR